MVNLLYLGVPVVLAVLVGTVVSLRGRKPPSVENGIDHFSKELRALAPESRPPGIQRSEQRG